MNEAPSAKPEKPKKRGKFKMALYLVLLLALVLVALFLFGPRATFTNNIRFDAAALGDDLDSYLAKSEDARSDVMPHAEKEIVWAYPTSKAKTPLSLVYIHGFSASKGEIRPVPDLVAEELKANLFYTRLEGHGAGSAAMGSATGQDWLDDTAEAIEIGARIGEKVIVIGTSTGATLASVAALSPSLKDKVDAFILISPNFKVQAAGSELLTFPYAEKWLPLIIGKERGFKPVNDAHAKFWTPQYPSKAILPMGALVAHAETLRYEKITQPALFIYSEQDTVVDHSASKLVMERWGGKTQPHAVTGADDPYNHVIAGDALSPNKNQEITDAIVDWIKALQ
jgi:alpha-beta hydrolase superfamily lysophospholipase